MSPSPTGEAADPPAQRVVLVVDLDGEPLTILSTLAELLADLAAWEEEDAADPPEQRAPLRLPAPLSGRVARAAVRRLQAALGSTPANRPALRRTMVGRWMPRPPPRTLPSSSPPRNKGL